MASQSASQKPVGPLLTELMRKARMRDAEVAFKCGVSPATVARWKRGVNEPTELGARALGELFGIDWHAFRDEIAA